MAECFYRTDVSNKKGIKPKGLIPDSLDINYQDPH